MNIEFKWILLEMQGRRAKLVLWYSSNYDCEVVTFSVMVITNYWRFKSRKMTEQYHLFTFLGSTYTYVHNTYVQILFLWLGQGC